MNEKEMNQSILAELKRIANEVFAKVKVSKEGTYTAAELWNGKNSMGEKIEIFYMGTASDVYTAKIGTFEFQVSAQDVFLRLWKFERLCNVKQADKMRFTYGNQEGENISAKAMYLDKEGKAIVRKKNLVKLSERVAIERDKKTKRYKMYYFVSGLWYLIALNFDESQYKAIKERIEKDENYLFNLLQRWDFNTENRLNPIYKALFEALKSERINNTPEQRKSENEPEKAVICDNVGTDTPEKSESVQETNEDYPPEPYNKEKSGNVASLATFDAGNVATSSGGLKVRTICDHAETSANSWGNCCPMLPGYLRQKVFPTELFCAGRKIRRYKPRYFVGYTNYHLNKESALERKRNANTSVYRELIRSGTGIISG